MKTGLTHLLLTWLILHCALAAAAGMDAWLDRTRIAAGESVQLTLELPGQVNDRPDTAPLEHDFDVLGVSSGSRVTIINGRSDARTSWTITLSPRHTGTLTVPALRVGAAQSAALTLLVDAAPATAGTGTGTDTDADIFIETEQAPARPYVQGEVHYTVRLLHAVPLRSGQLSEPAADTVLVQRLGEDRSYATTRNGRRYEVIERRYALFPQASGGLDLPAPVFDGEVPDTGRRRASPLSKFFGNDPFFGRAPFDDLLTPTRRVRVRGDAVRLDVQPRPDAATGSDWLPARQLQLTGHWEPAAGDARVGEPLTLQLEVTAQGLTGGQLPGLAPAAVAGFDIYPDQAQRETDAQESGVTGHLQQKIAFIPRRAGTFTLPALTLHWWDTGADRERVATLPERVVQILPGAQPAAQPPPMSAQEIAAAAPIPALAATAPVPVAAGPWPWVSALLAGGWLLTLLVWGWQARRRRTAAPPRPAPGGHDRVTTLRRRFRAACAAGDAAAARRNLLDWAAAHWRDDPPSGLQALAERLDDPATRSALAELDRAVYRAGTAWDGARLAARLQQLPVPPARSGRDDTVLAPLYPHPVAPPHG
ncbi:MAG: BatD family protein [Pseudomonadota bacterium]